MSNQEISHTPGPWEVFETHTGHYVLDSAEQAVVCQIEWCLEAEANARLIAAAPELLETVKQLIGYMNAGNWADMRIDGIKTAARAAIDKAEGMVEG
jgi:hypothetical protein